MKRFSSVVLLLVVLGFLAPAEAQLFDRGGGLIYDSVLNVTWLQDANYAKTSGYDADGLLTWSQAKEWASGLIYYDPVRKVTLTGWRLPITLPVNGSTYDYDVSYNGSTDWGYNISAPGSAYPGSKQSEMAFMYYNNLSGMGYYDLNGNYPQQGWKSVNPFPFTNLQLSVYWSSTIYSANPETAWYFSFEYGVQDNRIKPYEQYAWAVRDGDVAAPEPTQISIDIKPGDAANSINVWKGKTVPVAILSSTDFDALTDVEVDRLSLTFGPTGDEQSLLSCQFRKPKDVNGDGLKDLVCQFSINDAGFTCGDVEGILKGTTVTGTLFEGSQKVLITPCK